MANAFWGGYPEQRPEQVSGEGKDDRMACISEFVHLCWMGLRAGPFWSRVLSHRVSSWIRPTGLVAACCALLAVAPAAAQHVQIEGDQFALNRQVYKIKGTNYYPRDHMWAAMWSSFDVGAIRCEADLMAELGLSAVRILVPYSNGGWNGASVPAAKLDQLETVVNIMGDRGIRSVVTLFSWETSFPAAGTTREAEHIRHLNAIADRLKNNPYVLLWDVKNEPDHPDNYGWCDCNPGACGNWDCNPAERDQIVSWLNRMCNAVRARDPNRLLQAGRRLRVG